MDFIWQRKWMLLLVLASIIVISYRYEWSPNGIDENQAMDSAMQSNVDISNSLVSKKQIKNDHPSAVVPMLQEKNQVEQSLDVEKKKITNNKHEQKHFIMANVAGRELYFKWLTEHPINKMIDYWLGEIEQGDYTRILVSSNALISRLRTGGGDEYYQKLLTILNGNDELKTNITLKLLGDIPTPQSLHLLIGKYDNEFTDDSTRNLIASLITNMGDNRWDNKFHTELSGQLETLWNKNQVSHGLLEASAVSIAKIGASSGIKLLLNTIDKSRLPIGAINQTTDTKAFLALNALRKVSNPDAVPVLSNVLSRYHTDEAVVVASGEALSFVGNYDATKALLDWAMQATQTDLPLVKEWFGRMRNMDSIVLTKKVLDKYDEFQNLSVKAAVLQAVKKADPRDK